MTGSNVTGEALDAIVAGAGFGGLHMLFKLRSLGLKVIALEAAPDVGGAWYWNRYPGARCDVESLVYCYSFSPLLDAEWRWSERYATQPEIQAYLRFAAERLDLLRDIHFETRLTRANFDSNIDIWTLETESGSTYRARYFISATGPISAPVLPDIPGIQDFGGELYHTARWPGQEPVFAGKRVGVIGTGSSGTQLIPLVAKQAQRLTVFVRTPNFYIPAYNGPTTDDQYAWWVANRTLIRERLRDGTMTGAGDLFMPKELLETRRHPASDYTPARRLDIMEQRWKIGGAMAGVPFADMLTNQAVNDEVADFLRSKIKLAVRDPACAEAVTPRGYAHGTKRVCIGTDYYETFNRDNVDLVDLKIAPISRITASGVEVAGRNYELDTLICATGFDAITGALTGIDLRGRDGESISDVWKEGPQTFLGISVVGFPNFFMIGGPGSPSVLSNVVMTNEFQVDFLADLIMETRARGATRIDAKRASQERWTRTVNELVKLTLLANSKSWYVGDNIPGKPHVILAYTGGIHAYRTACNAVRDGGYVEYEFGSALSEYGRV